MVHTNAFGPTAAHTRCVARAGGITPTHGDLGAAGHGVVAGAREHLPGDIGSGGGPLELGRCPATTFADIKAEIVALACGQVNRARSGGVVAGQIIDAGDRRAIDGQAGAIVGGAVESVGTGGGCHEGVAVGHGEVVHADGCLIRAASLPVSIDGRSRGHEFEVTRRRGGATGVTADTENVPACIDLQALVNVDATKAIAVAVGGQSHLACVGADGLGACVTVDGAACDQRDGRVEQCAGQVAAQGDVAAINGDGTGRKQVGLQNDVFGFGQLADADAAVLGAQVPHVAQREVLGRSGAAGAETHGIGAIGLDGTRHTGVGVQDGVALHSDATGVAGSIVGGCADADAARRRAWAKTDGVVVGGGAACLLEGLHVNVAAGGQEAEPRAGAFDLHHQAGGIVLGGVGVAFDRDVAGVGLDQAAVGSS